jgi:hypothetical protein
MGGLGDASRASVGMAYACFDNALNSWSIYGDVNLE